MTWNAETAKIRQGAGLERVPIGSSVEFDWCGVQADADGGRGYKTIIINF
jgi:hypothetical protein